jgi:hypothetical protein
VRGEHTRVRGARDAEVLQDDREEPLELSCQRDETCPISTEGWTRRVHFVREGGGGGAFPLAAPAAACPPWG